MIAVTCPACAARCNAKEELAGKTIRCPRCREPIRVAPLPEVLPATPPKRQKRGRGGVALALAMVMVVGLIAGSIEALILLRPRGGSVPPVAQIDPDVWTSFYRPGWSKVPFKPGKTLEETQGLEGFEKVMATGLQEGGFKSLSVHPSVLTVDEASWRQLTLSQREDLLTLACLYLDAKGQDDRLEVHSEDGHYLAHWNKFLAEANLHRGQ
jgi:hypothetical protein